MKEQAVAARRRAILEVVENQMRDNNPPETRQTFDRLIGQGLSSEEAMRLIGCVVAAEIFEILERGSPFEMERYVAGLEALPSLPWEPTT